MRLLIVSPIASHPQSQGNSARIHTLGRALQALGHMVHFLYYPMEGLQPWQRDAMAACWDGFHTMPCELRIPEIAAHEDFRIDDWYDPALGAFAAALHRRWRFDAVIVNYVWISGVLDELPDDVLKLIDTHDMFGNRRETFDAIGLPPEWYHTGIDDECAGLRRAHRVIAIQSGEAAEFVRRLGLPGPQVITVGHPVPARPLPRRRPDGRLVVGYIGSGNPFNVVSMQRLADELSDASPALVDGCRFVMAGTICNALTPAPAPFESIGLVDDLAGFYADIDIAINPMLGGTGLKIKSLEALSFGRPLLGTADAWVGIADPEALWPGPPAHGMADRLEALLAEPALLDELHARCSTAYARYVQEQVQALDRLTAPAPAFWTPIPPSPDRRRTRKPAR